MRDERTESIGFGDQAIGYRLLAIGIRDQVMGYRLLAIGTVIKQICANRWLKKDYSCYSWSNLTQRRREPKDEGCGMKCQSQNSKPQTGRFNAEELWAMGYRLSEDLVVCHWFQKPKAHSL